MRGISTVLDVVVCLLLVSAAVATVTLPATQAPETGVASAASTLGTTTGDLSYRVRLPVSSENGTRDTVTDRRVANGTVANLLADAAVSNASTGAATAHGAFGGFRRAVRERTSRHLRWFHSTMQIQATWRPYLGSPLEGSLTVGPTPSAADVMVATLDVPSPITTVREQARAAASDGYGAVAETVAGATVRSLFPPRRMQLALNAGGVHRGLALRRYRRVAAGLDVDLGAALGAGLVGRANDRLATALADTFERDMRRRFASPRAAARAVRAGRVRVVVRGWDR